MKKNPLNIIFAPLLVAGIAMGCTETGMAAQQNKRPNFLLIVADDLGY